MSTYISTSANRLYTALESQYGTAAPISSANRISTVRLQAAQVPVAVRRQDKTGSRTFIGLPSGLRTETSFELITYMSSWTGTGQPGYGPLVQAAMGASPQVSTSLAIASATGLQIATTQLHGLSIGSGVSFCGEIRFVTSVVDELTFYMNGPFTNVPSPGATLAACTTYKLSTALPSVTIYDYWDPASSAISRMLVGAAVNEMQISVNTDFHEFTFSGPANDLIDSQTGVANQAAGWSFPAEPAMGSFDYSIVPGHLGQAWLGTTPSQFFSLTAANINVSNQIQMRAQEYGATKPLAIVPGPRRIEVGFSLFAYNDSATSALYAAGKLRSPIAAMFQLGLQQGRLMAVYIPAVTADVPLYDNSEARLQWQFRNCIASGVSDDEFYLAFA